MDWEQLRNAAADVADKVVNVTGEFVEKGKKQVDVLTLENKLAKAQRQLGALVYSLAQSGADQPGLVKQYIDEIAEIEQMLNQATEQGKKKTVTVSAKAVHVCSNCKSKVDICDNFCPNCGQRL